MIKLAELHEIADYTTINKTPHLGRVDDESVASHVGTLLIVERLSDARQPEVRDNNVVKVGHVHVFET